MSETLPTPSSAQEENDTPDDKRFIRGERFDATLFTGKYGPRGENWDLIPTPDNPSEFQVVVFPSGHDHFNGVRGMLAADTGRRLGLYQEEAPAPIDADPTGIGATYNKVHLYSDDSNGQDLDIKA